MPWKPKPRTEFRLVNGRPELVTWGLDRGRMLVASSLARGLWGAEYKREGARVHVFHRAFHVLEYDVMQDQYTLVADDSVWWAVWTLRNVIRRGWYGRVLRPWVGWLRRSGRWDPGMDGYVIRFEDIWVRTTWTPTPEWRCGRR
jgi:hypothetical protein